MATRKQMPLSIQKTEKKNPWGQDAMSTIEPEVIGERLHHRRRTFLPSEQTAGARHPPISTPATKKMLLQNSSTTSSRSLRRRWCFGSHFHTGHFETFLRAVQQRCWTSTCTGRIVWRDSGPIHSRQLFGRWLPLLARQGVVSLREDCGRLSPVVTHRFCRERGQPNTTLCHRPGQLKTSSGYLDQLVYTRVGQPKTLISLSVEWNIPLRKLIWTSSRASLKTVRKKLRQCAEEGPIRLIISTSM